MPRLNLEHLLNFLIIFLDNTFKKSTPKATGNRNQTQGNYSTSPSSNVEITCPVCYDGYKTVSRNNYEKFGKITVLHMQNQIHLFIS